MCCLEVATRDSLIEAAEKDQGLEKETFDDEPVAAEMDEGAEDGEEEEAGGEDDVVEDE